MSLGVPAVALLPQGEFPIAPQSPQELVAAVELGYHEWAGLQLLGSVIVKGLEIELKRSRETLSEVARHIV